MKYIAENNAMNRCTATLIGVMLFLFTPLGVVHGQETSVAQNETKCSWGGIYKPFSSWKRFQLATAYIVNPELVERTKIGKVYQLQTILEPEKAQDSEKAKDILARLADEKRMVGVAVWTEDTNNFRSLYCSTASSNEELTLMIKSHEAYGDRAYLIVEESKKREVKPILPDQQGRRVVSFDPSKAMALATLPELCREDRRRNLGGVSNPIFCSLQPS